MGKNLAENSFSCTLSSKIDFGGHVLGYFIRFRFHTDGHVRSNPQPVGLCTSFDVCNLVE